MAKKKTEPYIYHYTTCEGLFGIVQSQAIWATDVFYLNDSQEFRHGIGLAKDRLKMLRENATDKQMKIDLYDLSQHLEELRPGNCKPVYVCSFSEQADVLSQWRAYCRGGGFAIGFPRELLRREAAKRGFKLNRCIYTPSSQRARIEKAMAEHIDRVRSHHTPVASGHRALHRWLIRSKFTWDLTYTVPIIKHPAFSEDKEWRLISTPKTEELEPEKKIDPVQCRSAKGRIIPYREIKLPRGLLANAHVVVGPTPYPEETKASVKRLFRQVTGVAVGVKDTKVPYREW